jgi:hypothetical protein
VGFGKYLVTTLIAIWKNKFGEIEVESRWDCVRNLTVVQTKLRRKISNFEKVSANFATFFA